MNKFKLEYRKPKNVSAKKSFGQNFLVDPNYINKIIHALHPQNGETIVEIGAGRGALTEKLIKSGANVIAIELERDMITSLREKFDNCENFNLIESDALKVNFEQIIDMGSSAKLVANLPYYISTAILQKLIEQRNCFSEMILMFQREVVERITAQAGNSERGFLTVLVEAYLDADKLFDVPPNAFYPAPKVWSSVARLTPKNRVEIKNESLFREIISAGFRQKRKTIFNNLKSATENLSKKISEKGAVLAVFEELGIEKNLRAENLSLEEWKMFSNFLS